MSNGVLTLLPPLLAVVSGYAVAGAVRAAQTVFGVITVLLGGLIPLITTASVLRFRQGLSVDRLMVGVAVVTVAVSAGIGLLVEIAPELGRSLAGNSWPLVATILVPMVLSSALRGPVNAVPAVLRARRLFDTVISLRVRTSVPALALPLAGAVVWGLDGAAWGMAVAAVVNSVQSVRAYLLLRADERADEDAPGVADSTYDDAVLARTSPLTSRRLTRVAGMTRVTRYLIDHGRTPGRCVMIVEFPKSGGTWLARLIATSLEWPFLDNWTWPPGNDCVLRGHQLPQLDRPDQVYMLRDPRDVYVSLFHHRVRHWYSNERHRTEWLAEFEEPLEASRIVEQLPDFLRFEERFAGERGSAVPVGWSGHVDAWRAVSEQGQSGVCVTYEALRADPVSELRRVLVAIVGDPGPEIAEAAVTAHRFDLRQKAQFVHTSQSFLRSGSSGGWRSVFSAPAGEVLEELHGAAMRRAGYETSGGWWHDLPGS